jgi:Fe-S oxidoreductase
MAGRSLARNPCVRCGVSDMNCPVTSSLDELIDALANQGYEAHFNDIDARIARSAFSVCTNCGARGRFTYSGMKSEILYRAFWSCRACGHWVEV